MATYRHLARIASMQTLFAYEFRGGEPIQIHEYIADEFHPKLSELDFSKGIINGVIKEQKNIHKIIQEHAPEWPIEKIAPIDRAILEVGTYELLYIEDVPPIVSINEAIEIAKTFGEVNSGKFVNGVLSAIMKKHCPDKK